VHLLARLAQRERDRQPGVDVEAAAGPGDEDPPRVAQPGEQGGRAA